MIFDINNLYSGSYTLTAGGGMTLAGQAFTNGTTLSTNCIDHNPAQTPFGKNQNVAAGLGEPQAVLLQVTVAPVSTTGNETYTVNLLTDTASNLTTAPVTLASLTIARTTVVNTTFVLVLPPNLSFLRFSGLQLVTGGNSDAAISFFATLVPVRYLPGWEPYQSGWVIQNQ